MIFTLHLPKLIVVGAAACLMWIGIIVAVTTWIFQSPVSAGWWIAGALLAASLLWAGVMVREIRGAVHLPDEADEDFLAVSAALPARREMPSRSSIPTPGCRALRRGFSPAPVARRAIRRRRSARPAADSDFSGPRV